MFTVTVVMVFHHMTLRGSPLPYPANVYADTSFALYIHLRGRNPAILENLAPSYILG